MARCMFFQWLKRLFTGFIAKSYKFSRNCMGLAQINQILICVIYLSGRFFLYMTKSLLRSKWSWRDINVITPSLYLERKPKRLSGVADVFRSLTSQVAENRFADSWVVPNRWLVLSWFGLLTVLELFFLSLCRFKSCRVHLEPAR